MHFWHLTGDSGSTDCITAWGGGGSPTDSILDWNSNTMAVFHILSHFLPDYIQITVGENPFFKLPHIKATLHLQSAAVSQPSCVHTAGDRNAPWTWPPGVARTVCFKSADQMVLNKAPIIIICALPLWELHFFAVLQICEQSSYEYDAWTLISESQRMGMCQQKQKQV